jgi:hypothetical protein
MPSTLKTVRHENQYKTASQISGARTKLKFGASSWMLMALPQSRDLIKVVKVAIPDGI